MFGPRWLGSGAVVGVLALAGCQEDTPLEGDSGAGEGDGTGSADDGADGVVDGDGTGDASGDGSDDADDGGDGGTGDGGDDDGSGETGSGSGGGEGGWCTCSEPGCGECPDAPMVDLGDFEMDATEVTNSDYAMFLDADLNLDGQGPGCQWNTTFVPEEGWPYVAGDGQRPVGSVDWCDAYAYCEWAEKRLCGKIGGGPAGLGDVRDPLVSQWYAACTGGGVRGYPYGTDYESEACNGEEKGIGQLVEVGSLATCEGGYPGLFDLSGNVWEWVDACLGNVGPDDECRRRGGSFYSDAFTLQCLLDATQPRNFTNHNHGLRCCRD